MSKFYIVTKIARQVEGEYSLVNVLGAFHTPEGVKKFLEDKHIRYGETINGIPCVVDIGVISDVEFLDEEIKDNND